MCAPRHKTYVWGKVQLIGVVGSLFSCRLSPWNGAQAASLGGKHLHPSGRLTSPNAILKIKKRGYLERETLGGSTEFIKTRGGGWHAWNPTGWNEYRMRGVKTVSWKLIRNPSPLHMLSPKAMGSTATGPHVLFIS